MNVIERIEASQKTVDSFKGRNFVYGKADCAQLVITHARNMGTKIKIPAYGDHKSAVRALVKLGFKTLGQAMDHYFRRIATHEILAGDIVESLGSEGMSGLMIALGNGRTIGFHESIPFADVLQPLIITGAWRID